MFFSVIIPLYNRPQEIFELLQSLEQQYYRDFEVIVIEDGSRLKAEDIVTSFADRLPISYVFKQNEGQGFARNDGFSRARGDYFIVLDSDVLLPSEYLSRVYQGIQRDGWDAFGGADAYHPSFTVLQKAISYAMTSPLTTGGIRGNKKHVGVFHPRSFNMGISRKVWEETQGFHISRRSEDIEFSIRMIAKGFRVGLIPEAYVYHKRRTNLKQFFKQTFQFGKGRIDIYLRYPKELKFVHALPAVFVAGLVGLAMLSLFTSMTHGGIPVLRYLTLLGYGFLLVFSLALFVHAWRTTKELRVSLWSVVASFTQLTAYGAGFIQQYMDAVLRKK